VLIDDFMKIGGGYVILMRSVGRFNEI